ncbi:MULTISPECIES: 5-demethoxyubiquinol-8 5-hydroxylase UbiM [unclassified Azospirillum]|uniref:5-demethoxyubiquinol-8 5-hydroxylase UbiM n=1 Tax=unclassified Azospirillum TaxID=2630922 RepID=UPI000B7092BF|nr:MULTISPECIES: 5-demethoxyubiquinol-8 5-hydroxylase UbiM [unclassified Azospirillum]SNT16784.1 Ubiquinone biosynthesis hydroxylase, UbiH/UbiF/VisC/COQ6 family [Azospirillum sp. RU38E]SNT29007.1 Ubiquinone biosynthesis hydroxylase, UbiH/UbiF/VisC/COQ6 family [Azospirillum sp. RU37A]
MRDKASTHHDVIIIGGGPAGLAFARSLAGCGLDIAIVERQPLEALADPAFDGREIALTHRSAGIMAALGAWDRIDPAEIAPLRKAVVLNGGSPFALSFGGEAEGQDRLGHLVPNHLIRRSLFHSVAGQEGLSLITGQPVTEVRADRDQGLVRLADGRCLTGRLLVGADSRFSDVRGRLGIGAEINRLGRSMMVCRVDHEGDHGGVATEWFEHGHTMAMLPLNGRLSSAVLTLPTAAMDQLMRLSPAALGQDLTQRYRERLGGMRPVSAPYVYPLATTYSHNFVGTRAALIGDAAVGMHPVTAHGFNFGLQGQETLAGLIREAAEKGRDIAAPLLLRRYEMQHRLATRPLYTATNLIVGLYTDERLPQRLVRHAALRAAAGLPLIRQGVTRLLMQHR